MTLTNLVQQSKQLALSEAKKNGLPSPFHVTTAYLAGQKLAEKLNADKKIVAVGTYLMDYMLGVAFKSGRMQDHVQMSAKKTEEILAGYADINDSVKTNILACIREHHGVKTFSTLESEICCNADCYKFASIQGFIGGIHHGRKMDIQDLLALYENKVDEKWNILSLDICKKELKPQYLAIKKLILTYKKD